MTFAVTTFSKPRKRREYHGEGGRSRTPEYEAWAHMLRRCLNENYREFEDYGGRGIEVCAAWRESYAQFLVDMGRRPSPKHSLDRKNNDGDYAPDNCRWAVREVQNNNTRRNVYLTFRGETKTISQWTRALDFNRGLIAGRLRLGWSVEDALTIASQRIQAENPEKYGEFLVELL